MRRLFALTLAAATMAAACGGKGASPTAPSTTGAAPTTGASSGPETPANPLAATVAGTVSIPAATVAVIGTTLSTTADGSGRFTLTNVPAGDVQLRITASGVSATVSIGAVQPSQRVDVVVVVNGSSAAVDSEVHDTAGQAELEGHVEALPPTTAAGTFKAAGRTVKTDSSTQFVDSGRSKAFADLKVGMHVHVRGTTSGDTLTASIVELQTPDADHPAPPATPPAQNPPSNPEPKPEPKPEPTEAEVSGAIASLTGSASSFQFTLGSTLIKGDATTSITGGGSTPNTFSDLKNGVTVEVNGVQKDGFVQAVRIHIEKPDSAPEPAPAPGNGGEDGHGAEVELQGALGAVSGTCPAISSTVSGTKFTTSSSTTFDGAACSAFKSGDNVEVKGTKKPDGTVAATELSLKKK